MMKKEDIYLLISKSVDGDLNPEEKVHLAELMSQDPELVQLEAELRSQKEACNTPMPLPSLQLFDKLQSQVERHYPPSKPRFAKQWRGLAVAALVFLAFGAGYFMRPSERMSPETEPLAFNEVNSQVVQTRAAYIDAIERLEQLAAAHIQQMPPEVAIQVDENLKVVNNAIAACEDFARAYPNHHIAYASLAKAYQAKVELLETLVYESLRKS